MLACRICEVRGLERQLSDWKYKSRVFFLPCLVRTFILHCNFSVFSEFPLWGVCAVLSLFKLDVPYQLQLRFPMPVVSREFRMGITEGSCREESESRQVTACLLSRICLVFFCSQLLWTLGFLLEYLYAYGIVVHLKSKDFDALFFLLAFFSNFGSKLLCEIWHVIGIFIM